MKNYIQMSKRLNIIMKLLFSKKSKFLLKLMTKNFNSLDHFKEYFLKAENYNIDI